MAKKHDLSNSVSNTLFYYCRTQIPLSSSFPLFLKTGLMLLLTEFLVTNCLHITIQATNTELINPSLENKKTIKIKVVTNMYIVTSASLS